MLKNNYQMSNADDDITSEESRDCSICLEKFKIPKALPCLHTFCLKCLQEYITKSCFYKVQTYMTDGFTMLICPMCRQPFTSKEFEKYPLEVWANLFPTNYYTDLKICAKHNSKFINVVCNTSGIDMCGVCITDGHNDCEIFITKKAKKDATETLEGVLKEITEAVNLWKDQQDLEVKSNRRRERKYKKVKEKRNVPRCEKYIQLEKRMTKLQQRALAMQEKIAKRISAISSSEDNYLFSNDIGDASGLKRQVLDTFENLQNHSRKSEKCQCLRQNEFDSTLNSDKPEKSEPRENAIEEAIHPKEISYFFLSHHNGTECEKIASIKVLLDCSVIILCQTPHKVVKLSWCGEFISELLFSNQPSDMCLKADDQVAVSFSDQRRIDFVDVRGSRLHVTISFQTFRPYKKIATFGTSKLLATFSKSLDVLERHNNVLRISQTCPLSAPLSTLDSINGLPVMSYIDKRYAFGYDMAKNSIVWNFISIRVNAPVVGVSCSLNHSYFICADSHCVYRLKVPRKKYDESMGYLLIGIGKPLNIHVNKAGPMAVCSTNRKGDRTLIQIYKC